MTAAPTLGKPPRVLRPWRALPKDAEVLAAGWADPEVQAHLDVPADKSVAAAQKWMAGSGRRSTAIDLAIEIDGVVVGEVGASQIDTHRGTALVGWWLLPEARGKGHASWAVDTFAEWLLGPHGLARLGAIVGKTNRASIAVAQRSGFRFGATLPNDKMVLERRAASVRLPTTP